MEVGTSASNALWTVSWASGIGYASCGCFSVVWYSCFCCLAALVSTPPHPRTFFPPYFFACFSRLQNNSEWASRTHSIQCPITEFFSLCIRFNIKLASMWSYFSDTCRTDRKGLEERHGRWDRVALPSSIVCICASLKPWTSFPETVKP